MRPTLSKIQRLLSIAAIFTFGSMPLNVSAVETARLEGFGPVSRGLAGGGVAIATGAGAAMLNPAELLNLETTQELLLQLTEIGVEIDIKNNATGERVQNASLGNNRGPYYLPEIGYARRFGEWAFGTGVYAAGGFGVEYGDSFLSRTTTNNVETGLPISARIGQLRIPFALAWKPNQRLRFGGSLDVVNASLNLASLLDAQQIGELIQVGRVSGSLVPVLGSVPDLSGAHFEFVRDHPLAAELASWGLAGRLGVTYRLGEATTLGAAYEFETALNDLKGDGRLTAVDKDNNHLVLSGKGRVEDFQFPQAFVVGIAQRLAPTLAITADLRRTFWGETLANTVISFRAEDGSTLRAVLPTGFNNLTTLTLGTEWQASQQWTLRAGASHAFQSTVPGRYFSAVFPTLTDNVVVTNASYRTRSRTHQFDVGISLGFASPVVRNKGGNVGSIPPIEGRNRQINPVIGYSYHF